MQNLAAIMAHVTFMLMTDPVAPKIDFFVIGAARCGTTSLYRTLTTHPSVFTPEVKEPRFFRENFGRSWAWYAGLYSGARQNQLCGDFSPSYSVGLHSNIAAQRIGAHYPQAKLVYIVRNPIECAISNWRMTAEISGTRLPFAAAMEKEWNTVLIHRAMFYKQVQHYLRFFDPGSMLVAPLELVRTNPSDWLRKIQLHIGVPSELVRELAFPKTNASHLKHNRPTAPTVDAATRKRFLDAVLEDAHAILDWLHLPRNTWSLSPDSPSWEPRK